MTSTKVILDWSDGERTLELGKFSVIKGSKGLFYLEEMKDGRWRLTVSEDMDPRGTLRGLKVVR